MPLLYGATAAALALTGPGALSIDAALGLSTLSSSAIAWPALALGVLGGLANLAVRNPTATAAAASH